MEETSLAEEDNRRDRANVATATEETGAPPLGATTDAAADKDIRRDHEPGNDSRVTFNGFHCSFEQTNKQKNK